MQTRTLAVAAGVVTSFAALAALTLVLAARQIVTGEMAVLMLVALFGLYVGFGFLLAVHRLTIRLEKASGRQRRFQQQPTDSGDP